MVNLHLTWPKSNNLHQLVEGPTRIGTDGSCSKLDLFLTTSPDNHVVSVDSHLGYSDHCVAMVVAKYRLPTIQANLASVKSGCMTKLIGMVCALFYPAFQSLMVLILPGTV